MAGKEDAEQASGLEGEFSALLADAVNIHELHTTLLAAGFEEFAALWLTGVAIKGLPMPDWLTARLKPEEG